MSNTRLQELRRSFQQHGQAHVLAFWDRLDPQEREVFSAQLAKLDLDLVGRLAQLSRGGARASWTAPLGAAPVLRSTEEPSFGSLQHALTRGEEILRRRKVGVFLVAGGQGSRLGFDRPKGSLPVGVISGRSLFEIHALKLRRLREKYGASVPWYVMTSPSTDSATRDFFAEHRFFGLSEEDVVFLVQASLPALDESGRLVLEAPGRLLESPNGHGGAFAAFSMGGGLDHARERGVEHLFFFQVDNPLVRVADPLFVGLHDLSRAEMSLKVLAKTGPDEKIGVVVVAAGRTRVVEYSELSADEANARQPDGTLRHWAGSIAIHAFTLDFFARMGQGNALPYHVAHKRLRILDSQGCPREVDGLKFETFVFDALPRARRSLCVETAREAEFAPIKNLHGVDSLDSARELLAAEHRRWLERCGIEVQGEVEVSPAAALDGQDLEASLARWRGRRFAGPLRVERSDSGEVRLEPCALQR